MDGYGTICLSLSDMVKKHEHDEYASLFSFLSYVYK